MLEWLVNYQFKRISWHVFRKIGNAIGCFAPFTVNLFQMVVDGIDPAQVKGIGFDATCSLVVFDKNFEPVPVSPSGK